MAAYNSGEGNVSKAIARSGYADFWEIHRAGFLPNETRNYVPAILAVVIVSHNQQRYGFNVTPEPPMTYDLAQISSQTDLGVVAELCGTSEGVHPRPQPAPSPRHDAAGSCMLRIPTGKKTSFDTLYAALSARGTARPSAGSDDGDLADADGPTRDSRPASSGFGGGNSTASYTAHVRARRSRRSPRATASRRSSSPRVNKIDSGSELKTGQVLRVPSAERRRSTSTSRSRKATYRAKPERKAAPKKAAPAPRAKRRH
jgi:hypothetical protein